MDVQHLRAEVAYLAQLRRDLLSGQEEVESWRQQLEASPDFMRLRVLEQGVKNMRVLVEQKTDEVRVAAQYVYCETGNATPAPGIVIKQYSTPTYDPVELTAWAKTEMPALMVLDCKAAERMAADLKKQGAPIDITFAHRATIAQDLVGALANAEKETKNEVA